MDLNYFYYRQQIERSRATAARSAAARQVHEELAIEYERKIRRAFLWRLATLGKARKVNSTLAVALTAREVSPPGLSEPR